MRIIITLNENDAFYCENNLKNNNKKNTKIVTKVVCIASYYDIKEN